MSLFEIVTAVVLGVVSGVFVATIGDWKWIGFPRLVFLGALGGAIGALIGIAYSGGPVWGELGYHPMVALFACLGGASAVAALRLLQGDRRARRRVPAAHREGSSR